MKKYVAPDFDVTVYEIEDIITVSIGEEPDDDWFDGPAN